MQYISVLFACQCCLAKCSSSNPF